MQVLVKKETIKVDYWKVVREHVDDGESLLKSYTINKKGFGLKDTQE
jgi:hypothetical protein